MSLLEITDLHTQIRTRENVVHPVDGVSFHRGPRRDGGPGRRVGIWKDDDRYVHPAATPTGRFHHRRISSVRGP